MPSLDDLDAAIDREAPVDPLDAAIDGTAEIGRQRARASLYGAVRQNPDEYARAKQIERKTGLPAPLVARNLPEVQQRVALDDLDAAIGDAPVLGQLLQNPDFANLAHDDALSLSETEALIKGRMGIGKINGPAFRQPNVLQSPRGPQPGFNTILSGIRKAFPQGAEATKQGLRYQFADAIGSEEMATDAARKSAGVQSDILLSTPDFESSTASGLYGGGTSLLRQVPGLAASLLTRSTVPALGAAGIQTEAEAYSKYRLRGATPGEAFLGATAEGSTEVLTELLPMSFLVSKFGKAGAGEFLTGLLARELPTEQVATFVQDAIDTATANPDKTWGQFLEERPDAAYQTLLATIVQTGTMAAGHTAVQRLTAPAQQAEAAQQNAEALGKLTEIAKASKLRERDPQSFQEFVDAAAAEGPVQDVYVDARTFAQSLANAGVTPEQVAQASPSIAAQIEQALETGGDLRIPVGEYAAGIAATDAGAVLLPHLRTEPEGMSQAEATEFMQSQAAQFQAEVEKVMAEKQADTAFQESAAKVEAHFSEQLSGANRFTGDVNSAYSKLVGSFYTVQASRLGITPEEMLQRYPLQVRAESVSGATIMDQPGALRTVDVFGNGTRVDHYDDAKGVMYSAQRLVSGVRWSVFDAFPKEEGGDQILGKMFAYKSMDEAKAAIRGLRISASKKTNNSARYGAIPRWWAGEEKKIAKAILDAGIGVERFSSSTQSRSKYIYLDSGLKVRLADHALPMAYDQPGVDYRYGGNIAALVSEIKDAEGGVPAPDSAAIGAPESGMQERQAVRADKTGSPEEPAQSGIGAGSTHTLAQSAKVGTGDNYGQPNRDQPAIGTPGATGQELHGTIAGENPRDGWVESTSIRGADNRPTTLHRGAAPPLAPEHFDAAALGVATNRPSAGLGVWFTVDPREAESYGDREEFYLDLRNPLIVKADELPGFDSVEAAHGWREEQRAAGYDGLIVTARHLGGRVHTVAFDAEQVIYPPPPASIDVTEMFQSKTDTRDLLLQHNLTAENLLHAAKMGGIAVPSLAITKKDSPLTDAFGEITLLGSRDMADPKGYANTKVYGADIYSPRYPTVSYKLDSAALDKLNAALAPYRKEGERELYSGEIGSLDSLTQNDAFRKYAMEKEGKTEFWDLSFHAMQPLAAEMLQRAGATERIFQGYTSTGRRYTAHTLENVVKILKKELRGGEGFNYGVGSLRAKFTPQFRSIKQIKGNSGRLVSKEAFEATKEEVDQEFFAVSNALAPFYKYDSDAFRFSDTVMAVMEDAPKGLNAALARYDFADVSDEAKQEVVTFLEKLRTLPTAYFEAKILREVDLAEFEGAVVPEGVKPEVIAALEARGVKNIRYYKKGDAADRTAKIGEFENLFFQDERGKISFAEDITQSPSVISLLKNADLSTFLHELGHFQLEVLTSLATQPNAPQEVHDDASAVLKWFGVPDLPTWHNMPLEEKRGYHEQFARGFEAYLFEGNAPNPELSGVFARFRAWLLNVYKSIKALNVELTDEVRGVFDRLIATDEQIQAAEAARNYAPLFKTAEEAGMTAQEFADYQALGAEATQEAVDQLQTRSLRDMQWLRNARSRVLKQLQKEAEAKRRAVRSEVRSEVLSQPVYRAWAFLTGKLSAEDRITPPQGAKSDPNTLDETQDSLFAAIAKLGGLDKAQLVSEWGIDPKEKILSGVFGKQVTRAEGKGLSIDSMAEALSQYGYLTLDENGKWDLHEFKDKFGNELRGAPEYSDFFNFQPKALPGEQVVNLSALNAGRLDRGSLDVSTPEVIARVEALRMVAKDGLHPDLVAEMFGFHSGDELLQKLAAAYPPSSEIEGMTDQRMLERYGDINSPEALQRATDAAVHNDLRGRVIATELKALDKAVGKKPVLVKAAKQFAEQIIARKKVRDVKPAQFLAAEARAAKAAEKAKTLPEKATEKRNQLVNHYAARAAQDAVSEAEKALSYLKKFDTEGTRKAIDPDYIDQIDTMLERFDLRSGQSLKAIDKRKALADWIAAQEALGFEPTISDELRNEALRKSYKDMTVEEFRGLVDAVKNIEHLGRLKKKLLTAADGRAFAVVVDELAESIRANAKQTLDERRVSDRGFLVDASKIFKNFFADHRKFASLAREMDGWQDAGPLWEYLVRSMNKAGDTEAVMREQATIRLTELLKPILAEGGMAKKQYFASAGKAFTREERIGIALNMGNETNRERVVSGEALTPQALRDVLDTLTQKDWDFVQGVWDYLESYRPLIAEKERRLTGTTPEWVEPSPVNTKFGEYKGGYYPIKYDPERSTRAEADTASEVQRQIERGLYTRAQTRRGHLKARAESTGRPLRYDLNVVVQHVDQVVHDISWHEFLIDANRILRADPIDAAVREHYGPEKLRTMRDTLTDIAIGDLGAQSSGERILNYIRHGATIAGLGWRVTTSLLQPFGLTQSMSRIGSKWVLRGAKHWAGDAIRMQGSLKQIEGKSDFMRLRAKTLQREINEIRNKVSGKDSRIEASYFYLIQKMQIIADVPTWWGAYEKAMSEADMSEDKAVALADQAVRDAQGAGQIGDLAAIQRGGAGWKLFTNFYSFFNTTYNLTAEAVGRTDFKKPGDVGLLGVDLLLLYSIPAMLSTLLKAALAGDWDDEDKLARRMIADQLNFMLGTVVLLREAGGAVQSALGLQGDYGGPASVRIFGEITKLAKQAEQGEADEAFLKALNSAAGILFHYPAGQINATASGVAAIAEGKTENPGALLVGAPKK